MTFATEQAKIIRDQTLLLGSDLRRYRGQPYAEKAFQLATIFRDLPDDVLYGMRDRFLLIADRLREGEKR